MVKLGTNSVEAVSAVIELPKTKEPSASPFIILLLPNTFAVVSTILLSPTTTADSKILLLSPRIKASFTVSPTMLFIPEIFTSLLV